MPTVTIQLEDALDTRIAHIASATKQTPHSFMVQALADAVAEAESQLAWRDLASQRFQALRAGQPAIEWHVMQDWIQQRLELQLNTTLDKRRR